MPIPEFNRFRIETQDRDLFRVIDHINRMWDQRHTIVGNAYGPAELVATEGFIEHITDNLFTELSRKTRGKMVLEYKITWFCRPGENFYAPPNIEPGLTGFEVVEGNVQAHARASYALSMFAVQIKAVVIPGIPPERRTASDTFNSMMQAAIRQMPRYHDDPPMRPFAPGIPIQAPDTIGASDMDLTGNTTEIGSYITPEQIRRQLAAVDNQSPPTVDPEPFESEHMAVRHRPGDGAYPLDFDAVISSIDELTGDDQ